MGRSDLFLNLNFRTHCCYHTPLYFYLPLIPPDYPLLPLLYALICLTLDYLLVIYVPAF